MISQEKGSQNYILLRISKLLVKAELRKMEQEIPDKKKEEEEEEEDEN